jgi:TRAP-type C4-dicarboxylate transport system permease large subunit
MISCAVAKVPMRYAIKDTMIMLIPMLIVLCGVIVFPDLALFMPRMFAPEMMK